MSFDEQGWFVGVLEPLPTAQSFTLFSPEPSSRMDSDRWNQHAKKFFGASIGTAPSKRYDTGWPMVDRATLTIGRADCLPRSVELHTLPPARAAEALASARRAAIDMGGAGFDVLIARTKRIWQLPGDDPWTALLASAVIASVLLAPILTPGGKMFGVKGAREALAALAASKR
jgi:hypothetical protein